jgi:hypothetical protein
MQNMYKCAKKEANYTNTPKDAFYISTTKKVVGTSTTKGHTSHTHANNASYTNITKDANAIAERNSR